MENKKWTREEAEQNKNKLLEELNDFISGLKHGISLTNGTH